MTRTDYRNFVILTARSGRRYLAFTMDTRTRARLAVNPGLPIPEAAARNNGRTLTAGLIPLPLGLWAQTQPGSVLIFLGWDAAADGRVAGYVDLTASAIRSYRYAVTTYGAEGG